MRWEPDPPLPTVPGIRHRFVEVGSIRFHVAEAGSGPTLLLLHGEPQHWYAWRHVIPAVSDAYRVVCPDLRGMGWTDAPASGYTKEQLTSDVLGVIDALGLTDLRVVGHDYGCIVGFLLALRAPHLVRGLVALNAFHPWLTPVGLLANGPREWYQVLTALPGLGPRVIRHPRFWPTLMAARLVRDDVWAPGELAHFAQHVSDPQRARGTSQLSRTLPLDVPQWWRRYRNVRLDTPTHMIVGRRDPLISPQMVRGLAAHTSRLSIEYLDDVGHWLPNECPDVVIRAIRRHLP
jgi:pimeloyl-ACP methyl ester carboxylesterase